jgi:hypothetical protein
MRGSRKLSTWEPNLFEISEVEKTEKGRVQSRGRARPCPYSQIIKPERGRCSVLRHPLTHRAVLSRQSEAYGDHGDGLLYPSRLIAARGWRSN